MSHRTALGAWLRRLRSALAVEAAEALEPEDVQLDAFLIEQRLGTGWEIDFVDLRGTAQRVSTGVVPGAVSVRDGDLQAAVLELSPHCLWVLYASDTAEATRAALALRALGHENVWSMVGGLEAWRRAGGAVASEAT